MYRFHSPAKNISRDKIVISDASQVHHIKDVLRLKVGDEVIVFDEKGNEYRAVIENLLPQGVMALIKEKYKTILSKKVKVTIACAIPKKSKMDDIVDKLTQLGVDKIIPMQTSRVIVKLDKNKKISRQKRWEKIALAAAQQSQRRDVPAIEPIKALRAVLTEKYDLKLIPHLGEKEKTLKEIFLEHHPKSVLVLIGPEGDFTQEELNSAIKAGCIPLTLGDKVLRVDTAAIAVASFIRLYENH